MRTMRKSSSRPLRTKTHLLAWPRPTFLHQFDIARHLRRGKFRFQIRPYPNLLSALLPSLLLTVDVALQEVTSTEPQKPETSPVLAHHRLQSSHEHGPGGLGQTPRAETRWQSPTELEDCRRQISSRRRRLQTPLETPQRRRRSKIVFEVTSFALPRRVFGDGHFQPPI